MEEEAQKRNEFIEENIIKAGIVIEEIKKFAESSGKNFDSLNIEEIKDLIEKFKNKDNKDEENKEEPKIIKKENIKAKILVKENNVAKEKEESKDQEIKNEKEEIKKEEPKQEIPQKEEKKEENNVQDIKEEPKKEVNNIQEKKEEPKKEENQVPPQQKQEEKKEDNPQSQNQSNAQNINNNKVPNQSQSNLAKNPQQAPKKDLPKLTIHKGIYFLEPFNFKTVSQQNNKLLEFSKNKKNIQIIISEPKKESEGGFFSKAVFSYRVQCPELGSDVRRTYADFEWLRNQLNIRYPLRLVPIVAKENNVKQVGKNLRSENEENYELRKIRYLNKFIESVLKKKILATSPILYEFLVLDNQKLIKYKNLLEKKTYELEVGLNNLITIKGEVKCALEANTINNTESIISKSFSLAELYNRIITNIDLVVNDFNNLTLHFKEISLLFNILNKNLTAYKYTNVDDMKKSFNDLKILFEKWSVNINSQTEFFNSIIKENLNYMALELTDIEQPFKRYRDYKFEYEDFTTMIKKEKEDLLNTHIKEEMKKEVNKGKAPNQIKYNKEKFDELFYNKNLLLIEEKKRLCTTMHYLIKDYNKLIAIHCKKIKDINELVKKTVVIDFIKG